MLAQFTAPVLSITADTVRDLQGEAAVFGLWSVFTKCKYSLLDGQRLENISWRLWHREFSAHNSSTTPASSSPTTPSLELNSPILMSPSPSPVSDESTDKRINGPPLKSLHPTPPVYSSASRRPLPVGRIIFDLILPEKNLPLLPEKRPIIGSKEDIINLPAVIYPSTPPKVSSPKVVIVNPTPHPTPPATPLSCHPLHHSNSSNYLHLQAPVPATMKSGHLAPPYRSPVLTVIEHAQESVTSTPPEPHQPLSPSGVVTHVRGVSAKDEAAQCTSGSVQPRFFLKESPEHGDSSPDRASHPLDAATSIIAGEASSQGDSSIVGKSVSSGRAHSSFDSQKVESKLSKKGGAVPRRKPVHQVVVRQTRPGNHRVNSRLGQKRSKSSSNVPSAIVPAAPAAAVANLVMTRTVSARGETRTSKTTPAEQHGTDANPDPLLHEPPPSRPAMQRKASDRPTSGARAGPHQQRRGIVVDNFSTEYETTDSENDSVWASEHISPAEDRAHQRKAKKRQDEEKARRMRETEEEDRQRWERDMFAKLPRTSYTQLPERLSSGPGPRTRSVGLLSQLFNPDPVVFPQNTPYRTSFSTQDMTQFSRVSGLPMGRSSAAAPLASQTNAHVPSQQGGARGSGNGKYRPRGKPEGAEMDDDSGEEDENRVELSTSLAQQRLAALIGPNRKRRQLEEDEKLDQRQLPPGGPREYHAAGRAPTLTSISAAPIPLSHPYNLPAPPPPSTPKTTRRQMLATELSESLRRNLLWERQISKIGGGGPRRRSNGTILGGDGLRPLTTMDAPTNGGDGSNNESNAREGTRSGDESVNGTEQDPKEERRRRALAKNRSWADDYHYSGW